MNKIVAVNLGGDRLIVQTGDGVGYLASIGTRRRWPAMPFAALTLGDEFTTILPTELPTLAEVESYRLVGNRAGA